MSPENFCYFLQGYFEISKSNTLTELQVQEIKNHLDLVFKKVTPNLSTQSPYCSFTGTVNDLIYNTSVAKSGEKSAVFIC